ncbi:carbohydrate ABC transporter permease [Mahella sp.]|uniref:carbohydrate ABC transporter permease n=1 Tax=Mahella sp. TaxID=2798721 RepID=UPI0025C3FB66|nr:carbohydrate ABC transporter permease [Mahella sp.]MBZ4665287.1 transporter permease [Mahella sp.]
MNNYTIQGLKKIFIGSNEDQGLIFKIIVYSLLIGIGFIYLYPILYMISTSFKDLSDLLNPLVNWIPTKLYIDNFIKAVKVLDYGRALLDSIYVVTVSAVMQTVSSALIGYGFSRYEFPGKKILFAVMLLIFLIPSQVLTIPRFIMYQRLNLLGSALAFVIPASLGQGLFASLFILIFYQFFNMMPKSLEEAAAIDGADDWNIFMRVAVPSAGPAFLVSIIFSFVWYWNDTNSASMYFGNAVEMLPLQLQRFEATYTKIYPLADNSANYINEAIKMAGTVLTILPLLIMYLILQRWFIQSVDRTGITGE